MRREPRLSAFAVGAITLSVLVVIVYMGFTKTNPFHSAFELKAAFTTANQIKPKSPVRIAGVQVGKVKKVETLGAKGALITMEIEKNGLPLHSDARAKIRPRIFLEGNYFVDLEPGSPSKPELEEGSTLAITQTAAPVGFGRFLETFQNTTREDLRAVLQELGTAFDKGGSQGLNGAIRYWEAAFKNSALVADATRGVEEHDLSEYIANAGVVAEALDKDPVALKSLITNFAETADALANEGDALRRAIGVLDDTLLQGRQTFASLNAAFPPVRRLVKDLRPATRAAKPSLQAQLQLVPQLRKLVTPAELGGLAKDLRPAIPKLIELNKGGVPLQEQARALSSCQLQVILPTQEATIQDAAHPPTGKVYEEGVKWLPGIAGESRSFDANGQWIKTQGQSANFAYALGNGRFTFTTQPLQGVNPPRAAKHPPLKPEVPCETQEAPDLRTNPQAPPKAIRINRNTAAYREREAKADAAAIKWLVRQVKYEGLTKKLRVSKTPLSDAQAKALKKVGK